MHRKIFETELQRLKDEVVWLGNLVAQAILDAVEALQKRDLAASRDVLAMDREINAKRFEIENRVVTLIATQQPMAYDLRLLASIFEIASELERMGDYAKGITRVSLRIGEQPLLKPPLDLPQMACKATDMLRRALRAFAQDDVEMARVLPREDDEVDILYDRVYNELIGYVVQDPRVVAQANWLLWVAHNLERVGDRVTNLCERIIYTVSGEMTEMDTSDDEFRR